MNQIGERIKRRREQLNLQLNDLAQRVGISSSALSQIENTKTIPTLVTLKAIAENLSTTVGRLIGEHELLGKNPVIDRQNIRPMARSSSGTSVFQLSEQNPSKHMDTYLIRFVPASGLDGLSLGIYGQVFCHMLHGEVRLKLDEKVYILKQGDSGYFFANKSFDMVNSNHEESELIWVQSPSNQQ